MTLWVKVNFAVHVATICWCVVGIVKLYFGGWRGCLVWFDLATTIVLVCGAVIGALQTVVGLYKAHGTDCGNITDLAVWQIGLLVILASSWSMIVKV